MRRLGLLLVLLAPALASAQDLRDRFNIRVIAQGGYLTEAENEEDRIRQDKATFSLGWGDLRIIMDARRLPGQFELHLDGRVRISGEYSRDAAITQANQTTARGYLGGREYDLREAYFRRRGSKVDFALGRMFVVESDATKIDGGRLWWHIHKKWDASIFAGAYPNPFSRSLSTDYQYGDSYYGGTFAGGLTLNYTYDKFWGSVSGTAAYLGGNDDGGPLDPAAPQGRLATEGVRSFITWTGFERFVHWLDFYHSLVLDVAGAAGVQLTRFNFFTTARAGRFFTLRAGYDHMSSIAIEMFLLNLLQQRRDLMLVNAISNNLLVNRVARDEARLQANVHFGLVNIFTEGRVRFRSLVNPGEDPQFVDMMGNQAAPGLAWDATAGIRDSGSLRGLRLGTWYTYFNHFRSTSHILGVEIGRSFLDERLSFDLNFLYAKTRDQAAGDMTACGPGQTMPAVTSLIPACYGQRDGASYETALTITGSPSKRWFLLGDYRLVVNTYEPKATLLTHVLLLRVEARY